MSHVYVKRPSVNVDVKALFKPANHTSLAVVVCNSIAGSFVYCMNAFTFCSIYSQSKLSRRHSECIQ